MCTDNHKHLQGRRSHQKFFLWGRGGWLWVPCCGQNFQYFRTQGVYIKLKSKGCFQYFQYMWQCIWKSLNHFPPLPAPFQLWKLNAPLIQQTMPIHPQHYLLGVSYFSLRSFNFFHNICGFLLLMDLIDYGKRLNENDLDICWNRLT